ncbi:MAG: indole-3-glycerol phosphate synthase TrpC [Candidatus Hydrogenedentes bacterium]|jgi:indole-3-glycerol phosphate synthase|nr:indole-3-glycerol phosphate synthase TrpC [Candidatus Hydrogenedentota bacterium]
MILDEICEHKRVEVEAAKARAPLAELEDRIERVRAPRDFRQALREPGISLIAEIKRASPSKGVLLEDMDPVQLASLYESAGARAISVLTDEKYFRGSLGDLSIVSQQANLPCLRKEFVVDPYQIHEARAAGADALLLIVRVLSDKELESFLQITHALGMKALVETHNEEEIARALGAGAHIIGINNRNLANFSENVDLTLDLRKHVPGGNVLVSESGIRSRDHVRRLDDGGIDAVLIGEALVTSQNIAGKIRELLNDAG